MVDGLLNVANFGALVTLLSWPSLPCPGLVCPEVKEVEKTSPILERTLQFALSSLEACQNSTPAPCPVAAPKSDRVFAFWDFYSFWLGFAAGIFSLVVIYLCYRAFRCFVSSVLESLGVQPAAQPQRQLALPAEVVEPANRNTLRALGLAI